MKQMSKNISQEYIGVLLDKSSGKNYHSNPKRISAKKAFELTEKELRRLNTIIRNKKITDEHLANKIFMQLKHEASELVVNEYVEDHFTAAYYSFSEIKHKMEKENIFDYRGVKKYGYLISTLLYDIIPYANYVGGKEEDGYSFFNGWKSNVEISRWHFHGTMQLLYNCTFEKKVIDDKFALILSAVSLRQTLELKMRRILGLGDFYDKKGQKVFVKHHFFFDFVLEKKESINIEGVNIKLLQKVFEFCNYAVHMGLMPYVWQMLYAEKFTCPLFFDMNRNEDDKSWNAYSSVKINNYETIKQELEDKVRLSFPNTEYDLHFDWISPEAQIIDNK
ncbi:MAG: hypothetical protein R2800_06220 [Flavipsychrobacter sp.]